LGIVRRTRDRSPIQLFVSAEQSQSLFNFERGKGMSSSGLRAFDHTIQETNLWLNEIEMLLENSNRQLAYHSLRGVLFALRDRLPADQVFKLSSQLPMLIRGLFFERYAVTGRPLKYNVAEFLVRVESELRAVGGDDPQQATWAVLAVLQMHISDGELQAILDALPKDIRHLCRDALVE
jgi:uncharacterized protein (DUF2267 family)